VGAALPVGLHSISLLKNRDILILKFNPRAKHCACKKGGGVDIPILQVKIGLNFKTCKAEFVK